VQKQVVMAVGATLALALAAKADDVPSVPFSWTGYYFGAHLGSGLNKAEFSDPYGASLFGDDVRAPEFLIGLQGGYNWQAPGSPWVYGIELEASAPDGSGSNTCLAFSGEFVSSTCSTSPDFTGTLAGRLGFALGADGRTLLYAKGGGAVVHNDVMVTANHGFGGVPDGSNNASSLTRWGWLLGAGLEQALSPAWSMKFEYSYVGLGDKDLDTPASISVTPLGVISPVAGATTSIDQNEQTVKVGLNYRLGADPYATFAGGAAGGAAPYALAPGWRFAPALRYWYSVGRFQKDLPPAGTPFSTSLISRLTYDELAANAGEFYGRLDTPWHVFAKGFVGGGRIVGGHMNDEDWGDDGDGGFVGYSNTYSSLDDTGMRYATVDIGFDALNGADYRAGLFVGYAHVHEQYAATTCFQFASVSPDASCITPIIGQPVITETDTWNALRLGAAADVWLTPYLQLTADAAYLPYVHFKGRDNHWQRNIVIDERGSGHGGQLELLLSYYLSPEFSLGVGGRYWTAWTLNGSDIFDGDPTIRSDTYRYERYGVFLHGAYTFDTASQ
jgi:opacity protein-like surface antigen